MPRALFKIVLLLSSVATMSAVQAHAQDRYGASPYVNAVAPSAAAPTSIRARFLSWPGKTAPVARTQAAGMAGPAPQPPLQARFGAPAREDGRTLAAYRAAPVSSDGWRPVPLRSASPDLAGPPQASRASWRPAASIYNPAANDRVSSPAAAMPPPAYRTSAAIRPNDSVRFYSVHRQYGLQPDPPPIPPQFFSASADLSEPPGPIPAQRLTTASSGGTTATRTVRGTDGSDAAAQP